MGSASSTCLGTSSAASASTKPIVHSYASGKELGSDLASRVEALAKTFIAQKGEFTIAFSGGSLPGIVAPGLLAKKDEIDWSKWKIYFADERHVALDHADSNYKALKDAFLSALPVQPQVIAINNEVSVEEAAKAYEARLPSRPIDLILLGMGPDGHTASLFPDHPLLSEKSRKVAFIKDSPKPPPQRITLTLEYINSSPNVFFVTTGASKADVVARCAIEESKLEANPLPSARVRPKKGHLEWFMDADAASKL
jgi:6-phosphogluconolactonase